MSLFKKLFNKSKKQFLGDTNSPEFAVYTLNKLKDRRTPAIINFKGDSQQYVTMFLDLQEKHNVVILDELTPKEGHEKAKTGESFRVTSSDHGVTIYFKTHAIETRMEKGIAYYLTPLPKSIEYVQRRESFRIKVKSSDQRFIDCEINGKIFNSAIIYDLSFTGVSFIIKNLDLRNKINPGSLIESCKFKINNNTDFSCKLKIQRISYDPKENNSTIAASFFELKRDKQRVINKFITELERKELQKDSELSE